MTEKWADSRFQARLGPCRWTGLLKHQGVGDIFEKILWNDTIVLFEPVCPVDSLNNELKSLS